jgi:hypothetical protein
MTLPFRVGANARKWKSLHVPYSEAVSRDRLKKAVEGASSPTLQMSIRSLFLGSI